MRRIFTAALIKIRMRYQSFRAYCLHCLLLTDRNQQSMTACNIHALYSISHRYYANVFLYCTIFNLMISKQMKKRSEAMQTLRAGCSKVDTQTNKHTNRQGQIQYTAQLSMQCNQSESESYICKIIIVCDFETSTSTNPSVHT